MSASAFRHQYYEERLAFYERLDLRQLSAATLLDVAREASALQKFLTDILEEGYADAVHRLVAQIDAVNRLHRFLAAVLHVLGPPSERERFYLFPDPIPLDHITTAPFTGGTPCELSAYLDQLDAQSDQAVDITPCFATAHQRQRWQAKTQVLLTEMWAFLQWICRELLRRDPVIAVPLLRDTLLLELGLRWVRGAGVPVRVPRPVLIGRQFADTCGNGRRIHGALSDVLYRVLLADRGCDLTGLRRHFATAVRQDPAMPAAFTQACQEYLTGLALDAPPLFMDSGVQGTFMLFLLSLTGDVGEMVLYTTTPWLYPLYKPLVFQKNYHYLREMETIVAHDYLFQFTARRGGTIYVAETTNETARRLALYEIQAFKALVTQRMDEIRRETLLVARQW